MSALPFASVVRLARPTLALVLVLGASAGAQTKNSTRQVGIDAAGYVAPASEYAAAATSELRDVVDRWSTDRAALQRRFAVEYSPERRNRLREFHRGWQQRLPGIDFDKLSQEGRIDYVLLRNRIAWELEELKREEARWNESAPLLPFAPVIFGFIESRRSMVPMDAPATAKALAQLAADVDRTTKAVEAANKPGERAADKGADGDPSLKASRIVIYRTAEILTDLRTTMQEWQRFYGGYDPMFTWWTTAPYRKADSALVSYRRALRERVLGIRPGEDDPIVGDPLGRQAILADIQAEMIPYTPEELVAIAEKEFAWSEAEMKKASREMGFGDDWKKALEKVKQSYVPPGEQTELARMLAFEAIEFLEQKQLLTIPPLARDVWRMEMLTPERQKVAPFFLGGEILWVAFPTDGMPQEEKEMSLRGNNVHFSRAVVHHELIPGHHLQQFMTSRYNTHRRAFSTPFWGEGWALWWEMLLWDQGFPQTPENRVGMLFWRMHRSARIIFSLGFHLGTMTPQQAIDFLVDRVGHERASATAEVRRSFNGTYSPLYQVAYMMGGLQFRALHRELVGGGRMTNKDFHDTILRGGSIPVEMVRARLVNAPLTRDHRASWKYYGADPVRGR